MSNQEAVATEEPQVIEAAIADSVETEVEATSPPPDESEVGVPAGEAIVDSLEDTLTPEVDSAPEADSVSEAVSTAEAVAAPEADSVLEAVSTAEAVAAPEADSVSEAVSTAEAVAAPEADSVSEAVAAPEADSVSEAVAAPEADSASEAVAASEAASSPEAVESATTDLSIHSLKRGHYLKGKVKNITDFGAFVDIGLPQDGLVHISELARKKVDKVTDLVTVGDDVDVWIKRIDAKRGRISLTMVKPIALRLRDVADDAELEGTVTRLESYGAFVDIGSERDGLVHISQITHDYIKHPSDTLSSGDTVQVKVLKVNRKKRQVDLSIKALLTPPEVAEPAPAQVRAVKEIEEVSETEDEAVPTAMALAYAAMQSKGESADSQEDLEMMTDRDRRQQEMNDIVSRTLAASE